MSLISLEDKVKKKTPRKLVEMDNKRETMKIKALVKQVQRLNVCFRKRVRKHLEEMNNNKKKPLTT